MDEFSFQDLLFRSMNEDFSRLERMAVVHLPGNDSKDRPSALFFQYLGACRRQTPRTRVDLKVPKDARLAETFPAVPLPTRFVPRRSPSACAEKSPKMDPTPRSRRVISDEIRAYSNSNGHRGYQNRPVGVSAWGPNLNIYRDPRWGSALFLAPFSEHADGERRRGRRRGRSGGPVRGRRRGASSGAFSIGL